MTPNSKSKKGRDIVVVFYIVALIPLFFMTAQYIAYHLNAHQNASIYQGLIPVYALFGFNPYSPTVALQFSIPYGILIDALIAITAAYGAFEGTNSVLKTMGTNPGSAVPMPDYKVKRFFRIFLFWVLFSLLSAFYQVSIDPSTQITFYVDKVFTGTMTAALIYVYGRQGSKTAENIYIKQFDKKLGNEEVREEKNNVC